MHLSNEIRALLADPASLHGQQAMHRAAFAAWRASPDATGVFDAFLRFAKGTALADLPALSALFDGSRAGPDFAQALVSSMAPALTQAPLGQVPLRHSSARAATTLMLAREGAASLTLVALDGARLAAQPPAISAAFPPAEEWDAVIAGTGSGRLVVRRELAGPDDGALAVHPLSLAPGLALGRNAADEALLVDAADTTLVLLRLQRRRPGPAPVRELALADGRQLHQSAGSARESRNEIAVALLGRMGRADAVPTLASLARDEACGNMLRWQALRECLALDTLQGFHALCAIACREADTLSGAAGALRAQLIEHHPVLGSIEPCPA